MINFTARRPSNVNWFRVVPCHRCVPGVPRHFTVLPKVGYCTIIGPRSASGLLQSSQCHSTDPTYFYLKLNLSRSQGQPSNKRTFLTSRLLQITATASSTSSKEMQIQSQTSVEDPKNKDLVIYEQGTPDYFKKLSFLSVLQLIFFGVTAFTFGGLRDTSSTLNESEEEKMDKLEQLEVNESYRSSAEESKDQLPFWRRVNLGDPSVKMGLQTGAAAVGYLFLALTWLFIYRSVHFIVLRRDSRAATIVTYAPFGRHRYIDVLVNEVSAEGSRHDRLVPKMILRVKGHALTYKVDLRNGRFRRPELFDSTLGRRRNLD